MACMFAGPSKIQVSHLYATCQLYTIEGRETWETFLWAKGEKTRWAWLCSVLWRWSSSLLSSDMSNDGGGPTSIPCPWLTSYFFGLYCQDCTNLSDDTSPSLCPLVLSLHAKVFIRLELEPSVDQLADQFFFPKSHELRYLVWFSPYNQTKPTPTYVLHDDIHTCIH